MNYDIAIRYNLIVYSITGFFNTIKELLARKDKSMT